MKSTNITTLLNIGGIEYDVDFDVLSWPASADEPAGGEVLLNYAEPLGDHHDPDDLHPKDVIEQACWDYFVSNQGELS